MIDRLEVGYKHPLFLTSHPLEGVEDKASEDERQKRLDSFLLELQNLGVKTVTVLLPSTELEKLHPSEDLISFYQKRGLKVIHYPLENFSIPQAGESFDQLCSNILTSLDEAPSLIHCLAGCGRTAIVAAGVLIKVGTSAPDAIEKVYNTRRGAQFTIKQIQFLRDYAHSIQQ